MKFYNEISKEDFNKQMLNMVNAQLNVNMEPDDITVEVVIGDKISNFDKIRVGIEATKIPAKQ